MRLPLFALIVLASLCAHAEVVKIVRGDGNYPPYETQADGKLGGAHIELIEAAAKEAGVEVRIDSVAWARALELTKRGLADAVSFASRTPEREGFLIFLDGNIESALRFGFFCLRGGACPAWDGHYGMLAPYRIGVARAYAYPAEFTQETTLVKIEQDGGYEALLRALHNRRVDLIIGGTQEVTDSAAKMGYGSEIQLLPPTFGEMPSYLAFSREGNGPALAEKFATAFGRLRANGTYQRILGKYGISAN